MGVTPIPGLGRKPIYNATPDLAKQIASKVRAAALLSRNTRKLIGRHYQVGDAQKSLWKPRALVQTDLVLSKAVDRMRGKDTTNSSTSVARHISKVTAQILHCPC